VKRFIVSVFLLVAIALPASTSAYTTYPKVNEVASKIAMRPVEVRCPATVAWKTDFFAQGAWGYVFLGDDHTTLSPLLCERLWGVINHDYSEGALWTYGLAVLVLTHESYHLRNSGWNASEAKVECAAIRHVRYVAQFLGATPEEANMIRWGALYYHWKLAAKAPAYHLTSCKVPRP
jgi:hypothetical protein